MCFPRDERHVNQCGSSFATWGCHLGQPSLSLPLVPSQSQTSVFWTHICWTSDLKTPQMQVAWSSSERESRLALQMNYVRLSRSIRSQAALSAALNLIWIWCTQSRPATIIRAKINWSVSSREASNSFRASLRSLTFHGSPDASSIQWNTLAVLNISLYNERASLWRVAKVKCLVSSWGDLGIQTCGGMADESMYAIAVCSIPTGLLYILFVFIDGAARIYVCTVLYMLLRVCCLYMLGLGFD